MGFFSVPRLIRERLSHLRVKWFWHSRNFWKGMGALKILIIILWIACTFSLGSLSIPFTLGKGGCVIFFNGLSCDKLQMVKTFISDTDLKLTWPTYLIRKACRLACNSKMKCKISSNPELWLGRKYDMSSSLDGFS